MNVNIHRIINNLKANNFFRGVLIIASGTIFAQVIPILCAPILSRLYTPANFGILGVYISFVSILAGVCSLSYEKAIPLPKDDSDSINIVAVGLLSVALFSFTVFLILQFCGDWILKILNSSEIYPFRGLISLSLLGIGFYTVLTYWVLRRKNFSNLARTKVTQSSGQIIGQVILGFIGMKTLGLLIGDVIGRLLGIGTLLKITIQQDKNLFSEIHIYRIKAVAIRYKDFPLITNWANLLHSAAGTVPTLLFAALFGSQVAGWFMFGARIISLPIGVVGGSIAQVFLSEAATLARQDPRLLLAMFNKTIKNLFMIGIIPSIILLVSSPWLFSTIFGTVWREAGVYITICAISIFIQFIVGPVFSIINILEQQKWQLSCDALGMFLVLVGIFMSYFLGWPARVAVALYAIAVSIMYLSLLIMSKKAINNVLAKYD